ncbi:hypothetical protein ACOSQ4_031133 [Xanthoceras sorbifolium]
MKPRVRAEWTKEGDNEINTGYGRVLRKTKRKRSARRRRQEKRRKEEASAWQGAATAVVAGFPTENFPGQEFFLQQEQMIHLDSAQSDGASFMRKNLTELPTSDRDRIGLQQEILESLFVVPERSEEATKRKIIVRPARRSRTFGKVVAQPYKDTTKKNKTVSAEAQEDPRDVSWLLYLIL